MRCRRPRWRSWPSRLHVTADAFLVDRFYVALSDGAPAAVATLTEQEQECFPPKCSRWTFCGCVPRRHGRRPRQGQAPRQEAQVSPKQQAELRRTHATGDYSIADLTELFSVSRPTVYRTLQRAVRASANRQWLGPPKTAASARTITLPAFLAVLLKHHLATHNHSPVFPNSDGGFLWRRSWRTRVFNIPEIAQAHRLGHRLDKRVVEVYSHVADEVEARIHAALKQAWLDARHTIADHPTPPPVTPRTGCIRRHLPDNNSSHPEGTVKRSTIQMPEPGTPTSTNTPADNDVNDQIWSTPLQIHPHIRSSPGLNTISKDQHHKTQKGR